MCFGGDDAPEAPIIAPPPKPKEMRNFFNRLARVGSVVVKDEQGRPRDEVIRLPGTPQEEAFLTDMQTGLHTAIGNIKRISQTTPTMLPSFMPFMNTLGNIDQEIVKDLTQIAGLESIENDVKSFRTISNQYLNERFDAQSRALEDSLAQRGLSQSSQGDKERRELNQQFNKAAVDNDWNALQYGENLATQKLANRITGFNARQMGRTSQINTAATGYNTERQKWFDEQALRRSELQEQGSLAEQQNKILQQDFTNAMGANTPANQLGRYQVDNAIQLEHYRADVDTQYKNYDMQIKQFNAENAAPDMLSTVLNLGGQAAVGYMTGGASLASGSLASSLGAAVGNRVRNSRPPLSSNIHQVAPYRHQDY